MIFNVHSLAEKHFCKSLSSKWRRWRDSRYCQSDYGESKGSAFTLCKCAKCPLKCSKLILLCFCTPLPMTSPVPAYPLAPDAWCDCLSAVKPPPFPGSQSHPEAGRGERLLGPAPKGCQVQFTWWCPTPTVSLLGHKSFHPPVRMLWVSSEPDGLCSFPLCAWKCNWSSLVQCTIRQ